ncbi:acyl-CoA dehydrogenase family protein [Desulfoluna butyratoxydans]|uniref:Acyl-coa dehydrogenase/oxidase c-terminal n=1 Tax=Desulfoluna butyratoxydans TaxID=231438 RepID=A0A4U8YJU8_9BACT|nr:acyl-CoA dehydrogenase family protein [Desulfoluna butyratoxydans]VFQ43931.1 acyl-coa dehydrogenase/oxidase c-terminal [Desulfoluna butyratoxydans]
MNFEHTREERDLFLSLETILGTHPDEHPKALINLLSDTGYTTLDAPGLATALPGAQERLAQWNPTAYRTVEYGLRIAAPLMERFGQKSWQAEWVAPVQSGKTLATAAFETPPGAKGLTGTPHTNETFISGTLTGIPGADIADLIVAAGTVDEAPALFLIEQGTPDISLTRGATGLFTLTARGASLAHTHVTVLEPSAPMASLLTLLKTQLQASEATGHAAALFEQAKKAAKTKPGGGKPPIARQEVGFTLATMYTLLQTSRLMNANASALIATEESDAAMAAHCARVFCSDAAEEIVSSALSVMGEQGFEKGGPADRLATIQALRVEGASVGQTKEAIGNMLLKY